MQVLFNSDWKMVFVFLETDKCTCTILFKQYVFYQVAEFLSVIDHKDNIHLGFPLKSNCLGYVLGGRVYCVVTIAYYSYSHNILITNLSFRNNSFGGNN